MCVDRERVHCGDHWDREHPGSREPVGDPADRAVPRWPTWLDEVGGEADVEVGDLDAGLDRRVQAVGQGGARREVGPAAGEAGEYPRGVRPRDLPAWPLASTRGESGWRDEPELPRRA